LVDQVVVISPAILEKTIADFVRQLSVHYASWR
jgi:hypothetical protein